ncbi:NADPH-dependent FMN reductase [Xylaria bambusicola]|uniref:NADPH-dependent FMN reductase n=1 Tax=Xylaria bambusicola TaxID=326684 RepID=UPI00200768E0|nr:NADPH-dependent FMN reductase [Xylaria bambusicola]KAI0503361.1 NADPH-dependent FMN reductase [Xylaria bambusicola]
MATKSVALITMSLRPARIGANVAAFVQPIFQKAFSAGNVDLAPVDLRDFNLPIFNENVVPAMVPAFAQFEHEHSRAWSAEIAKHDGYVIVIPEYNYGLAGGTKNAIDYLLNEWKGKPLVVVSYGAHGGSKASEQAKDILGGLGLRIAETRPQLAFADPHGEMAGILAEGKVADASRAKWEGQTDQIIKAAEELKELLLQPNDPANAPTA